MAATATALLIAVLCLVLSNVHGDAVLDAMSKLDRNSANFNATSVEKDLISKIYLQYPELHRILALSGIPFQTVFEKIKEDPDLSTTYTVGSHRSDFWNRKLADTTKRFTYFVPSNAAWAELQKSMPSEHKQLVEGILPVHGEYVLERHLLIADTEAISSAQLQQMNGETVRTLRGKLKVETDKGELWLVWEGIRARITRPDVHAINGVIHVIDNIFIKKRDMTTTTTATASATGIVSTLTLTLLSLLMAHTL